MNEGGRDGGSPWLTLLKDVAEGRISPEDALTRWRHPEGDAALETYVPDLKRSQRLGFPEVVYGEGKSPGDLHAICAELLSVEPRLLVTRADASQFAALQALPHDPRFDPRSRAIVFGDLPAPTKGRIGILCAGTTDVPVAEEAAVTASLGGLAVQRHYDVGVAGLHRLLTRLDDLAECELLIVVAGMEGALPSVVGGLVPQPVIAVPTSVGYGASFGGLAAVLGMLSSCAPGVVLVNIDNGFGAGYAALRWLDRRRPKS